MSVVYVLQGVAVGGKVGPGGWGLVGGGVGGGVRVGRGVLVWGGVGVFGGVLVGVSGGPPGVMVGVGVSGQGGWANTSFMPGSTRMVSHENSVLFISSSCTPMVA